MAMYEKHVFFCLYTYVFLTPNHFVRRHLFVIFFVSFKGYYKIKYEDLWLKAMVTPPEQGLGELLRMGYHGEMETYCCINDRG